jgi:hypothetical protein
LSITKQQASALSDLEQANAQAPENIHILEALTTAYATNNRPCDAMRIALKF